MDKIIEIREKAKIKFQNSKVNDIKENICPYCNEKSYESEVCLKTGVKHQSKSFVIGGKEFNKKIIESNDLIKSIEFKRIRWCPSEYVKTVEIEQNALDMFKSFILKHKFQYMRIGILFGRQDKSNIRVYTIYQPPQLSTGSTFQIQIDKHWDKIRKVLESFDLNIVGYIFSHPPRSSDINEKENSINKKVVLTAPETLYLMKLINIARGHAKNNEKSYIPLSCVSITISPNIQTKSIDVEAYTLSEQSLNLYQLDFFNHEMIYEIDATHPKIKDFSEKQDILNFRLNPFIFCNKSVEIQIEIKNGNKTFKKYQDTNYINTEFFTQPIAISTFRENQITNKFISLNQSIITEFSKCKFFGENALDINLLNKWFSMSMVNQNYSFLNALSDYQLILYICYHSICEFDNSKNDILKIIKAIQEKDSFNLKDFESKIKSIIKI